MEGRGSSAGRGIREGADRVARHPRPEPPPRTSVVASSSPWPSLDCPTLDRRSRLSPLLGFRFSQLPFRYRLAVVSALTVVLTLVFVLTPVYRQSRASLAGLHGERLAAIARSASVAIPAESLDVIATA